MKKTLITLIAMVLFTSCCFTQIIPTQYAYVDDSCSATLPDFTSIIDATDNCGVADITQLPAPGLTIFNTTVVELVVIDLAGNDISTSFEVVLLDTIAPTIQLREGWAYTDKEVGDMYRTFVGWIQLQEHKFRDNFPFEDGPLVGFEKIDLISDTYMNIITVPDTIHNEWWWAGDVIVAARE